MRNRNTFQTTIYQQTMFQNLPVSTHTVLNFRASESFPCLVPTRYLHESLLSYTSNPGHSKTSLTQLRKLRCVKTFQGKFFTNSNLTINIFDVEAENEIAKYENFAPKLTFSIKNNICNVDPNGSFHAYRYYYKQIKHHCFFLHAK